MRRGYTYRTGRVYNCPLLKVPPARRGNGGRQLPFFVKSGAAIGISTHSRTGTALPVGLRRRRCRPS